MNSIVTVTESAIYNFYFYSNVYIPNSNVLYKEVAHINKLISTSIFVNILLIFVNIFRNVSILQ